MPTKRGKLVTEEASSTQQFVTVENLKDGVITLKNKGMRMIVMCSSINFDLKSQEEKDAIIYRYQAFLNSLDFAVEISINSRKLNIEPYVEFLKGKLAEQSTELLRIQIAEYIDFIQSLVRLTNVMTKNFYVTIPFAPIETKSEGMFEKFMEAVSGIKPEKKKKAEEEQEKFEEYRTQLLQRVDHIIMGLRGVEVRAVLLTTEDITELLYLLYNPSEGEKGVSFKEPGSAV
ncbi:MAG: hypothetical protein Q7S09_05750 [bacterium]|nr:hypothetical protein [bacterium]